MKYISILSLTASLVMTTEAISGKRQLLQTNPFKWPLYSQQCQDDAGPPFADDEETFGNGKYHDNSQATAVLKNGECADPLKSACEKRSGESPLTPEVAREAYLEGPLQCGGKGWFCRILPDQSHDGGLQVDWNFNHCNRTDYGDTDGHCHGSDNDETYYWWVRDHWHRNYAGRLHCCCDWGATLGVVARCDYRASLRPGENQNCRDANEEHTGPGSGFSKGFEEGCPNLGTTSPLPEPRDAQCWDVLKFAPGYGPGSPIDQNEQGDGEYPTNEGQPTQEEEDNDSPTGEPRPSEENDESSTDENQPSYEEEDEESSPGESQHSYEEDEESSTDEDQSSEDKDEESSTDESRPSHEEDEGSLTDASRPSYEEDEESSAGESRPEDEESPIGRLKRNRNRRGRL